jgi:GWxTD domain-containing protein
MDHGIMLGENSGLLLQLRPDFQLKNVRLSLHRFEGEDEKTSVLCDTLVSFTCEAGKSIILRDSSISGVEAILTLGSTSVAFVSLPSAPWKQGRYSLRLALDGTDTAGLSEELFVRWPQMPQSLTDLDFSIAAMKHYLSEDEYDELRSGGRATRIRKFEEFWKKKDPTPATAYNEAMAEYFRRVDIAFVQFRTIKSDNGTATDRGKIFILYGSPVTVERTLDPGKAPREIWKYPSLGKTFMFEDPSRQGEYTLISPEN